MNKGLCKLYIIGLFSFFLIVNGKGQNATSSPYSMFGIGELQKRGAGRSSALGGAGFALSSGSGLNNLNPASLAGVDSLSAIFEIGVGGKYSMYTSERESQNDLTGNFKYLAFGCRLKPNWGFSVGIRPFSSVGYNINTVQEVDGSNSSFYIEHAGSGGLSQFFIASGYSPVKGLSIGASASYIFGMVEQDDWFYLNNSDSYTAYRDAKYYLHNVVFEFGLQYGFKVKDTKIALGATYSNEQTLKSEMQDNMLFYTGDTLIDEVVTLADFVLPEAFGVGVSIQQGEKFTFAADYSTQMWHKSMSYNTQADVKQSHKFSAGVEYVPSMAKNSSYLERTCYRLGGYYHDTYLQFGSETLKKYALTFGFGLPFKGGRNSVNLAFELGTYGTTANGLIKENYGAFHLNFRLNEKWFDKVKYY